MNNKLKIILAFIFIANLCFSQQKGILLSSKTDDEVEFYNENKRVKIETNDGKNYTGRIQIVDENTIAIDNENIPISNIIKIRSQSVFSTILSAGFIIIGGAAIITGIAAGGYGILLVPPGIVVTGVGTLIPAIGNNHKKYSWDYKIVADYNPENENK